MPTSDVERAGVPVIVLGTGITALGVVRILVRDGLSAYVGETRDPLLRRSRWFRPLPGVDVSLRAGSLEQQLRDLPFDRAALMPCSDSWVREVAMLSPSLRERFSASVPAPDTLDRFVDKGRFADMLTEFETPHPFTRIVDSPSDLATVPDSVFASAILKPRDSQRFMLRYGVKACHVASRAYAGEKMERLIADGFPVVLQEYIPGPATHHYFVDGFVDRHGEVRALFVRQRLRMYPLDFGNSTYMVSVDREAAAPAVTAISALLRAVSYRGMFSAEFKLDLRDGDFKLLEVNARAWWYVDFAARCGVDVVRMAYDDGLGREVASVKSYAVGRRLVYPYFDYHACRSMKGKDKVSRLRCLRSWIGAMQPLNQLRDPAPGMFFVAKTLGGSVVRRMRTILSSTIPIVVLAVKHPR